MVLNLTDWALKPHRRQKWLFSVNTVMKQWGRSLIRDPREQTYLYLAPADTVFLFCNVCFCSSDLALTRPSCKHTRRGHARSLSASDCSPHAPISPCADPVIQPRLIWSDLRPTRPTDVRVISNEATRGRGLFHPSLFQELIFIPLTSNAVQWKLASNWDPSYKVFCQLFIFGISH